MNRTLLAYVNGLEKEAEQIKPERKEQLRPVSDAIRNKLRNRQPAKLLFICTHNSRRSHFCQIWAATLAHHLGLEGVEAYSGGTEVTAFNPRAVRALKRAGFTIEHPGGENPPCEVYFDERKDPLLCYSKTYDDPANPSEQVIALMTCSDAERNCPVISGTEFRTAIPYDDPKQADGTPREAEVYDERCRHIATEMYYILSQLK